ANVVTVGYQRPAFMTGAAAQVFENGLYRPAAGSPTPAPICPPAPKRRPSARKAWPLQKRSYPGCASAVTLASAGFHSRGSLELPPLAVQIITFPVGRR